jgi:hypothetical protein
MTLVSEITSKNWSISKDVQGEIVTDVDDINQCIYIIVTTVKRTDPLRVQFGCGLWEWLDKPVNVAIPNMIREISVAIDKWEPRAEVTKITYQLDLSTVIFSIYWKSSFGSSQTIIPINLQ